MSTTCRLLTYLWIEVVYYRNYLVNISPIRTKCGITLKKFYKKIKSSVDHLRKFGLVTYLHILKEDGTKLGSKIIKCIFFEL